MLDPDLLFLRTIYHAVDLRELVIERSRALPEISLLHLVLARGTLVGRRCGQQSVYIPGYRPWHLPFLSHCFWR